VLIPKVADTAQPKIYCADPDDVTALEFFDKGYNGLFVAVGGAHLARG